MLSGLTSRVGTLIGGGSSNKSTGSTEVGGGTSSSVDGSSSTSTEVKSSTDNVTGGGDDTTAAGGGSAAGTSTSTASGVLGSVRSQLPSWLGGGGSKVGTGDDSVPNPPAALVQEHSGSASLAPEQLKPKKRPGKSGKATNKESKEGDDSSNDGNGSDASSATGGADDDQQLSDEGEGGGGGGPTTAGLEKVKNLGNLLYSTLLGAGQKIKETTILGDFQREHDTFLRSKFGHRSSVSLPPWIGHPQEDELKLEILSLSNDRRNFVRCPPVGVSFSWDWDSMAPVANALLKEDPNLQKMRYTLVPKVISEDDFWRNYFYRVSLLKESMIGGSESIGLLPGETIPSNKDSKRNNKKVLDDDELERELNEELQSFEVIPSTGGSGSGKKDSDEIDALLDLK